MDGYVARTKDGGKSWHPWTPENNPIPRTHLFGITSDHSDRLVIVGNNFLLSSGVDRNVASHLPATGNRLKYGWLYGVAKSGPGKFVAVGKEGWIYLVDENHPTRRVTISR